MVKKVSVKKSAASKKNWINIVLPLILVSIWAFYSFYPRQSADIFVVESRPSGYTEYQGILQKDSSLDEVGNYYLSLDDGSVLPLVGDDLDYLVNNEVIVSGEVIMANDGSSFIVPDNISLNE